MVPSCSFRKEEGRKEVKKKGGRGEEEGKRETLSGTPCMHVTAFTVDF